MTAPKKTTIVDFLLHLLAFVWYAVARALGLYGPETGRTSRNHKPG